MRLIDGDALLEKINNLPYASIIKQTFAAEDVIRVVANAPAISDNRCENNGLCEYYHVEYGQGVCWGTKEKDPCPHDGDRSVCGYA